MARPRNEHPTPAELEVLKVLWNRGPSTVREVLDELKSRRRPRAYTSVMSLMNVMDEKGLLSRTPEGRAFRYAAKKQRERTLSRMVGDLWDRAYEGSTSSLVAHLLDETNPSSEELAEIRKAIESYQQEQEGSR
jgi:predicted transcriptional regulator